MKNSFAGIRFCGCLFAFVVALLTSEPTTAQNAQELSVVFGEWGTQKQCERRPIKQGGTHLAQPFRISNDWLYHGNVWCNLSWFDPIIRETGLFVVANAICGEDARRGYKLGLLFNENVQSEELTLFWDEDFVNGPLFRCDEGMSF